MNKIESSSTINKTVITTDKNGNVKKNHNITTTINSSSVSQRVLTSRDKFKNGVSFVSGLSRILLAFLFLALFLRYFNDRPNLPSFTSLLSYLSNINIYTIPFNLGNVSLDLGIFSFLEPVLNIIVSIFNILVFIVNGLISSFQYFIYLINFLFM